MGTASLRALYAGNTKQAAAKLAGISRQTGHQLHPRASTAYQPGGLTVLPVSSVFRAPGRLHPPRPEIAATVQPPLIGGSAGFTLFVRLSPLSIYRGEETR